jgi:aspartate ammonia-lyase
MSSTQEPIVQVFPLELTLEEAQSGLNGVMQMPYVQVRDSAPALENAIVKAFADARQGEKRTAQLTLNEINLLRTAIGTTVVWAAANDFMVRAAKAVEEASPQEAQS